MQKAFAQFLVCFLLLLFTTSVSAQWKRTMQWKAIFAAGISYPFTSGFVQGSYAQPINFPSINLGVQRNFKQEYGVRLDYSYNRFGSDKESAEFKINYTRFNLQFVYDPTQYIDFIPYRFATVLHAGPGISFSKPLGGIRDRNQTYANLMGGLEVHYAITRRLSVFMDFSYIWGLTSLEDYNPPLSGLGAFNGNVMTITVGLSISLSGCQFCD